MKQTMILLVFALFLLCSCETYTSSTNQPTDYKTLAYQDAINAGIPSDLFVKQIQTESGFDPGASSPAGAIGIAQFMPETARGLGINPWNAEESLNGAAHLMARFVANYGDYRKALAAYNCGSNCLASAMRNCSYYYWCLPLETERYIDKVMS